MTEATTATLKTNQGELKEFKVETPLVLEECSALRHKLQPDSSLVVDLDACILELVVSFLQFRKMIRDQFPGDDLVNRPAWRPKKKRIQQMESDWVDAVFHGKYSPTFAKLMMAADHLGCNSLKEVLAEWIVEKMVDIYPKEINDFFGIECDLPEELLLKHRKDYDWAYKNVENSLKQRRKRAMMDDNTNIKGHDVMQAKETATPELPQHLNCDKAATSEL